MLGCQQEKRTKLRVKNCRCQNQTGRECPGIVLTDDGTYDTEIQSRIWKAKDFLN